MTTTTLDDNLKAQAIRMAETLADMNQNMQAHFAKQAVDMRDHCNLRYEETERSVYLREAEYQDLVLAVYIRIKADDLRDEEARAAYAKYLKEH